MFSYQFLCTFTVAPHNGHPTRWGLHLFIANHGLQPTMVCMDISTPMTHGYMASVFVIPPTSSICGPSQRVASVTLLTMDEMQSTAAQFIQVRVHLVLLLTQVETLRLQPFCRWCGCCSAEERGP